MIIRADELVLHMARPRQARSVPEEYEFQLWRAVEARRRRCMKEAPERNQDRKQK